MVMTLTKDQIKKAQDTKTEEVQVPEWGGSLFIKTMTGKARDALEMSMVKANGEQDRTNIRARFVIATAVDEKGKPLFDEADTEWLGQKSAAALDRCFAVSQRLNHITDNDVEDLAKN
jgi:hypothetical protein